MDALRLVKAIGGSVFDVISDFVNRRGRFS